MAAPTIVQPPPPPVEDLLAHVAITREGQYPSIECIFRPCYPVQGTNGLGLPYFPPAPGAGAYTLFLDSRRPLAAMQIGGLMEAVRLRIMAGESVDDAISNEAYDLRAACVALNSTAAILEQLGVEVRGANPFPP